MTTSSAPYFLSSPIKTLVQCYRTKTELTTSLDSSLLPYFHRSSCFVHFLVCEGPSRPDTAVACLHVKFQLGESFARRHMSHEPSVGAHERSRRPIASVKSVNSAALRVSDPNPPYILTTPPHSSAPYHPTPTLNMSSSTPPSS